MGKQKTLQEKKKILEFYKINGFKKTIETFGISYHALSTWRKLDLQNNLTESNTGKFGGPTKGRPKKKPKTYSEMTKEELIRELEFIDDLRKFHASLKKKNTKQ